MTGPTIRVVARLHEPVAVGTSPGAANLVDTHRHVPGAVLRGALAAEWIRRLGPPTAGAAHRDQFVVVFEGDGAFGPLHTPLGLPVPLSVRMHKYGPGRQCDQLWWDEALGDTTTACPKCGQRLEFAKGAPDLPPTTVSSTRAALSTAGVAMEGQLYTRRALAPGQVLTGWVTGPACDAFSAAGSPIEQVLLGGRRSTGGTASLEVQSDVQPDPVECHDSTVVLRLASPGVFVDRFGLPARRPDITQIRELLGDPRAKLDGRDWTRWDEVAGWHAASGLPKPTERAVAAGSTYLVQCARPPTEDRLRRLRVAGLGLRRREGFGALCPPMKPPTGMATFTGRVAAIRGADNPSELINRLAGRRNVLLGAQEEDTELVRRAGDPGAVGEALRILLDIRDPRLYDQLLDFLRA